jgi:adenylate cyclase
MAVMGAGYETIAALCQLREAAMDLRPGKICSEPRANGIAMAVTDEEAGWNLRNLRSNLRLISALTMLAFVVCHLTAHSFLLISFERAEAARNILMYPWRTSIGTVVLVTALMVHYLNALWSIYVRRYLRLARWEGWQLGLGLCIPMLLMLHVASTRIAEACWTSIATTARS